MDDMPFTIDDAGRAYDLHGNYIGEAVHPVTDDERKALLGELYHRFPLQDELRDRAENGLDEGTFSE